MQQSRSARIGRLAEPAAWRLALAPPATPAAERRHADLIVPGRLPGLEDAAGRPPRWVMTHHETQRPVTVHRIEAGQTRRSTQQHAYAELLLILPADQLVCEVVLGDELYVVDGPATIFVPAGLAHAVNAKSGAGLYVELSAEGWNSGTAPSHPARRTATSDGGVSRRTRSSAWRETCAS